jgi:hypothetical protein
VRLFDRSGSGENKSWMEQHDGVLYVVSRGIVLQCTS